MIAVLRNCKFGNDDFLFRVLQLFFVYLSLTKCIHGAPNTDRNKNTNLIFYYYHYITLAPSLFYSFIYFFFRKKKQGKYGSLKTEIPFKKHHTFAGYEKKEQYSVVSSIQSIAA